MFRVKFVEKNEVRICMPNIIFSSVLQFWSFFLFSCCISLCYLTHEYHKSYLSTQFFHDYSYLGRFFFSCFT